MASSNLVLSIIAVDKASKTLGGIGKSIGKMSINTAALGATLVAFGATSIKAFSESEQAQVKLNDAFNRFPNLADTNVAALNALNSELQKKTRFDDESFAAGEATLAQYGLTGQQLKDLTPLVADFAAKTGKSLPEAAGAVGKALLGQGRALKSVGIDFKDAGSTGANFTQVMGGLRTQVGGFAEKEGQTAAGKAAILKNQFNDLQETVGGLLVPVLSSVVGVLTPIIEGFNSLPSPVRNATLLIAGTATAIYLLAPSVISAVKAFTAFRTALALTTAMTAAFDVSLIAAIAPLALVAVAVVALIGVLAAVGTSMATQAAIVDASAASLRAFNEAASPQGLKDLRDELTPAQSAVEDWSKATSFADGASDTWNRGITALSGVFRNSNTVLEQGAEDTKTLNQAQSDLNQVIDIVSRTTGKSKDEVKGLADMYKVDLSNGVDAAAVALSQATMSSGALSAAQAVMADTASTVADKVKAYKDILDTLGGNFIDAQAANDNLTTSIQKAQAAITKNGGSLKGNSAAALANRAALRDVANAADDASAAVFKQTGNQDKANVALVRGRADVIKMATKLGMSKTAAEKYATSLGLIPKTVPTKIIPTVEVSAKDKKYLDELKKLGLTGTNTPMVLRLDLYAAATHRATGGFVSANTPYIIGERRPELFVPSTSGRIVPRVPNVGTMAAGGTTIIVNTGQSVSSKDDIAREIRKIMREGAQRGAVPAAWNVA